MAGLLDGTGTANPEDLATLLGIYGGGDGSAPFSGPTGADGTIEASSVGDGGAPAATGDGAAAAAPSAAPAAADGGGAGWGDRILSALGGVVGGGSSGIAPLSPAQEQAANRRALMNFGLTMLQGSGPTYEKRSFGQILAAGLQAGMTTRQAAEQAQAVMGVQAQQTGIQRAQLGLQMQDRALREAEFRLKLAQFQGAKEAVGRLGNLFAGGQPAGGITGTPAAGTAAAGPPLPGDLPAPQPGIDLANFKDPALRDLIVQTATKEGVDPKTALAFAYQESGGDPNAPPGDGGKSKGPYQIGDPEAKSVGVDDTSTMVGNVTAGVRYLKGLKDQYGGDVGKMALAYNAGTGRASDVLAGKAAIPDSTKQYIANVRALAGPPAAAPDLGFEPVSGLRTRAGPGAPGTGAGAPAPAQVTAVSQLPPDMQALYQARFAATGGDPAKVEAVSGDLANTIKEYSNRDRYTQLTPQDAQARLGPAYNPTATYEVNQKDNSLRVAQTGIPPIPLEQTPAFKRQQMIQQLDEKQLTSLQTAADSARGQQNSLQMMETLNAGAGKPNVLMKDYPQIFDTLRSLNIGSPQEMQRWSASDAFMGMARKLAIEMRPQGSGRLSNMEMEKFQAALPDLGKTPEGRQVIISMLGTLAGRQQQEYTFARNWLTTHPDLTGMSDSIDKPEAQGGLGPLAMQMPLNDASAALFYNGLPAGTRYRDQEGTIRVKGGRR